MDGKFNQKKLIDKMFELLPIIFKNEKLSIDEEIEYEYPHLSDFFEADELYKAYPQLKNLNIDFFTPRLAKKYGEDTLAESIALYSAENDGIFINSIHAANPHFEDVFLHEIQHIIQRIEGFARGGSPDNFNHNRVKISSRQVKVDGNIYKDTIEAYGHLAGEAESRNVQRRKDLSKEERRKTLLSETLDTTKPLIVRYNQAANSDVDLDENVNVVKINSTLDNVPFYQRMKAFGKDKRAELLNKFKGGVVNKHTGLKITLSNLGLNHILDTARDTDSRGGEISYQAIPFLDKLVENAYRVETHKDTKPKVGTEGQKGILRNVHRFYVPVNLDGENHVLKLTAKEHDNGKIEVDEISLYDMKYIKKSPSTPSKDSPNSIGRATQTLGDPDKISVREMLTGVKDSDGKAFIDNSVKDKPETYNQILGEKGTAELDKAEGNTYRMDNLKVAKEMANAGKDAKTIRLATGWEKGVDGKWRWEIMDGEFNWEKVNKKVHQDENNPVYPKYSLDEIFKNDELFKAYPNLKDIKVKFSDLRKSTTLGQYNPLTKNIEMNLYQTPEKMGSVII